MADIGELSAHIELNTRPLRRDLDRAQGMFRRFSTVAVRSLSRISSSMISMGKTAALIGGTAGIGALVAGFFKATKAGMGFELTMLTVGGVMRATKSEMVELTAIARKMGEETEFSASQAGEGLQFLGMAGFNVKKAIAALPAVMDLATAKTMDLGRATDIATNILDAMGLSVRQLPHVMDVLVGTTNRANVDIQGLADGFRMGASVASDFNVSLEELSAWIGLLGGKGIPGQMAGRGLAAGMLKAAKAARELGLQSNNYVDVLEELEKRGETGEAIYERFGDVAGRAASQMQKIVGQARALKKELVEIGPESQTLADVIRGSVGNKLKEFFSALESSAIDAFEEYKEQLRTGIEKMTEFVREHKGFATAIANSAVKIIQHWRGVARIDLSQTELKLANIGESIATAAAAMGRLLAGLGKLALWVERNVGVLTAIGALTGAVKGAKLGAPFGPKGIAVGAVGGAVLGGVAVHEIVRPPRPFFTPSSMMTQGVNPFELSKKAQFKQFLLGQEVAAEAGAGGAGKAGAKGGAGLLGQTSAELVDGDFDEHIKAWREFIRRRDAMVKKSRDVRARVLEVWDAEILKKKVDRERRALEGLDRSRAMQASNLADEAAERIKNSWDSIFTELITGAQSLTGVLFNAMRIMDRFRGEKGIKGIIGRLAGPAIMGAGIGSLVGGLTGQSGLGSSIGGGIGGILGKMGGQALTGFLPDALMKFAGPVGGILGSIGGSLIGGLFGGKKKDPVRAAIKQWVSTELRPALDRMQRLGFSAGKFGPQNFPGSAVGMPGGSDFFKAAGFAQGIPQQWLQNMEKMARSMKNILGTALSDAFDAASSATGFRRFLRDIRGGLSDFVQEGIIKGLLKGSAFTKALAPIIEGSQKIFGQLGRGKISEGVAESRLATLFDKGLPAIERLAPALESLHNLLKNFDAHMQGTSGGTLAEALQGVGINITVISNSAEGAVIGKDIGVELSRLNFSM